MTDRQTPPSPDGTGPKGPTLEELDARLREARKESPDSAPRGPTGAQIGYRVGVEMLGGVIGGAGIGWLLDRWFGTNPWLMVVMMLMGFAAGVLNAYRAGKRVSAQTTQTTDGTDKTS